MIYPKLIHPVIIYVAQFLAAETKFDDKWHTRQGSNPLKYRGLDDKGKIDDETELLQLPAQLHNSVMMLFEKKTGGWTRESKMSFWLKSDDVIDVDGKYRFDKGDRIVRMADVASATVTGLDLMIRDVIYRAPYRRFEFIELVCEKQTAQV